MNLGKPSGITLRDHTLHVVEQAEYVLEKNSFLIEKYRLLTKGDLRKELIEATKYHDWGKAYPKWQNACQTDNLIYKKWRIEKGLPKDEVNAEEYRQFEKEMFKQNKVCGPNLMKAKLRHEFASLLYIEKHKLNSSPIVKAAIAAHHGKLGFKSLHRWEGDGIEGLRTEGPFYKYWKEFKQLSNRNKDTLKIQQLLIERFRFSAVRSLLQLADTRASRLEGEGDQAFYEFKRFEIKNKYEKLRPVQEAAKELSNQPISILRAPTGSGKTYASLLWADNQINPENGELAKADRLVIAMPTRFTSNALSISVGEQIDETGLYHSSAWFNRYGDITDSEVKKIASEAHRMARFLATPISVCTIDHLLISLTGTKEQHHSTFFFLANSAVVFDEADFYDPFVQANIVVLIEVLNVLKVPVLIMSATVPDSAKSLYNINYPIKSPNIQPSKVVKKLQWVGTDDIDISKERIMDMMLEKGTGIIYANTVERALKYYRYLEKYSNRNKVPLVIYHSRFTEPNKKDIEEKLISKLGKNAWENNHNESVKGIAIMTQIGEMSVNISTPIMLSDLCPWDRLAQRVGRLVRFEEADFGICYVVEPQKDGEFYPAPYGDYDRKERKWIPNDSLKKTRNQLIQSYNEDKEITPKDFEDLVNELYPDAPSIIGHAAFNQKKYRDLIRDNWLILSSESVNEEDGQTQEWSSRHIPPQQTVFTVLKPRFSSYSEFQEHVLQFGISCPVYSIEKELKKGERSKMIPVQVFIGKSEEEVSIYYTSNYNSNLGLAFLYESDLDPEFKDKEL